MYGWLEQLLLDEYAFTFLVTALSVIFKALTTGQRAVLRRRETYDLGLEFVFVAISFGLSNLAEINRRFQLLQGQLNMLTAGGTDAATLIPASLNGSTPLPHSLEKQLNGELIRLDMAGSALWIMVGCLTALLLLMVLMMRSFGKREDSKPDLWRGIILPNVMGIVAVILVMAHIYEIN